MSLVSDPHTRSTEPSTPSPSALRRVLAPVGAALMLLGCNGLIADPGDEDVTGTGPDRPDPGRSLEPVECEGADPTMPYRDLVRLTNYEHTNTLRAILPRGAFSAALVGTPLIPDDRLGTGFDTHAQSVSMSHITGYAAVAELVGRHLRESVESRDRLAECFRRDPGEPCAASFIASFGARAFRRPLTDEEQERYLGLYRGAADDPPRAMQLIVSAMLQAPAFLMKLEIAGDDVPGTDDRIYLTDHELAQKLAYYVTGAPPDAELTAAVDAGGLRDDAGLEAELDRLLAKEAAVPHIRRFFAQWLWLEQVPDLENLPPHLGRIHTLHLNWAVTEEIAGLVDKIVWEGGAYRDLMTTRESFLARAGVAQIYGVAYEGEGFVTLDETRAGLLTRVALLANTDGIEHPIMRGKLIREQLLCRPLPLPDPEALPDGALEDPEPDPTATTRERYEALTSGPECQTCHQAINPLGFALGGYDGIGRFRTTEQIFDEEGALVGELPVDTRVDPAIVEPGLDEVDGAVELGALLAEHPEATSCFAEQWLAYNNGRPAERTDACAIADLANAAAHEEDASVLSMMRRWVMRPEFRIRRIAREEGVRR